MAILSTLLRGSRVHEVVGCPLAPPAGAARGEEACRGCPYNVIARGHPRIGCTLATPAAHYRAAFGQLQARSPGPAQEAERLLAAQRAAVDEPLNAAAAERLVALAEHWPSSFERGSPEATVVTALLAFARYTVETGEPVRVLA